MRRPGERARSFFARWCTDKMMRQRIDPAIADMQAEYRHVRLERRVWLGRWVQLAGYAALAKLAVCCAGERVGRAVVDWPAGDVRRFARVVVACGVATTAMALLLMVKEAADFRMLLAKSGYATALFLLPYALTVTVPLGLVLGIAWCREEVGRRVGAAVIALALGVSMAAVVNVGWIIPTANQAYRTRIFAAAGWVGELPPKGDNELTLTELNRSLDVHRRLRTAAAPIALVLFMLTVPARTRVRRVAKAGAVLAIWAAALSFTGRPGASLEALWLPHLMFVLLALGRWRNERALTQRA